MSGRLALVIESEAVAAAAVWESLGLARAHTGELAGLPPSGKQLDFTASDIFQMVNGKIVESWHNVDDLGLLQQIGVIPALG